MLDPSRGDHRTDGRQKRRPWNRNPWITTLLFLIGMALLIWIWKPFGIFPDGAAEISYSRFRSQLKSGNVVSVTVQGQEVQGTLEEPIEFEQNGEQVQREEFITHLPSFGDEELLSLLEAHEVEVETVPENDTSWIGILVNILPFALLIMLILPLFRRMRSQGQNLFSMGKSQARRYTQRAERITFDDVAGLEEAKHELREIIEFLKDPDKFQRLGGEMPKGVLLVGPPGTGKTLLARAVAGEADVPFFIITGSDFMEMFVGVGASRVRDLFKAAKGAAPSIIFIDELDSIGRRRGAGLGGGHDEREQTLNQLLSELDGFEPNENVVVMAATNRPDVLDPALLRPGRFDRRVTVNLPTLSERVEILRIHARNKPLASEVDLDKIARGTPGFSGADLENLLNEAALLAARKEKDVIEDEDLEEARDKVLLGLKREGLTLSEKEMRLIAYHEGGHALLAALLPHADPIHKVTIVPRGRSMGVTQQLPERDKYLYSQEYIQDRLAVMMGGRAAERLVFDTSTNGAENDLKEATRLGRRMVLDWGMSRRMGSMALGSQQEHVFLGREISQRREYSEETAREIDLEVKSILDQAFQLATDRLRENRGLLDSIAEQLIEREEMTGEEVQELVEAHREEASKQKEVEHG